MLRELPGIRVVAGALSAELARGPHHLRAERAQLVRHGVVGEPAVAVERPPRLRHRLHEGTLQPRSA